MKNKMMTGLSIAALMVSFSATTAMAHDCGKKCAPPKPEVVHTCEKCSVSSTIITPHATQTGQFHEIIYPKDANGNVLGCLDVSGTSVKTGKDWTTTDGATFTWGTHTTKKNSAKVVEERYTQ